MHLVYVKTGNVLISILIFMLIVTLSTCDDIASASKHVSLPELGCDNTTCTCKWITKQTLVEKLIITCSGTGTEKAAATSLLFKGENVQDMDSEVYVLLEKFRSVTISDEFLSKWLAYTSCSMDLWYNSEVIFPAVTPEKGESGAPPYFAGIGLAYSTVSSFPSNLFKERDMIHLTLSSSSISQMDLGEILGNTPFSKIVISHSTVNVLKSSKPVEFKSYRATFQILHSYIGVLDKGGLVFSDTGYKTYVVVEDSTIGIVREGSIEIEKDVSLSISRSTIGHLDKSSIKLGQESNFKMTENSLSLLQDSMSDITCNSKQNISSNYMFPLDFNKYCTGGSDSEECLNTTSSIDYIDSSCGKNYLFSLFPPSASNPNPGPKEMESKGFIKLPIYLFIVVSSFLLLMVLVQSAMLVCRKSPAQNNSQFTASSPPFFDDAAPVYFSPKSQLGGSVMLML